MNRTQEAKAIMKKRKGQLDCIKILNTCIARDEKLTRHEKIYMQDAYLTKKWYLEYVINSPKSVHESKQPREMGRGQKQATLRRGKMNGQ